MEKMEYVLGKNYIDKAGNNHPDDQFLRWINITGSGMLNSPGIRPLSFISDLKNFGLPAYLILVTHEKTSGSLNPWDDVIDLSNAEILYWGDAKNNETKALDDFKGNKTLRQIYDYILSGQKNLVPPILHFSKPAVGTVKFNGLCVLNKLEISWFDDHGSPIRNYHAHLTILDCEKVSIKWLHSRVKTDTPNQIDSHEHCPEAWKSYKKGHKKPIDIWASRIRAESEQLPPPDSVDAKILLSLLTLDSFAFEKVIVALFKELTDITHHISGTRATGDGGFDFFGTFIFPRPTRYEISFRGEVKRYARSTSVDPKSVSRLVARLSRKEYGIFVTTSYFTKQAQREVLSDEYPIHLISGLDLVYMFKHLRLVSQGQIRQDWLEAVIGTTRSANET
jgi:hypothetical protein